MCFFFSISVTGYGQASLNLDYTNPSEIVICGEEVTFETEVRNITTSTVTGITVSIDLPPGVKYISGSLSGNGTYEDNITNSNVPVFSIDDLAITRAVTFRIKITANCDLGSLVNNGGLANIKITSDYSGGSLSITTKPLSVRQPSLNIKDITNRFATVNLGDTIVRKITLSNFGQGELRRFQFTQVNQNGMKIIGVSGGKLTFSNDTIRAVFDSSHFKLTGDKDAVFELNETVEIYDTLVVLECERLKSFYHLEWGCDGQICNAVTTSANLTVSTRAPKLFIRPVDGKTACLNSANFQTNGLVITNTGNDTARKIELNVFNSYNGGYYNRILTEIDISTLRYREGASGTWKSVTPAGVELVDTSGAFECLSAYPVGGVTMYVPDLVPGDTLWVEWKTRSCCIDGCGANFYSHRWRYLPSYYDQCGNKIIDAESWGSAGYVQSFSMTSTTPSDVLDGEAARFIFTVANGTLMAISGKSRLDAWFILPSGFSHTLNKDDFAFYNLNGGAWKPQSVIQKGDTIHARFSGYPTTTLSLSELIVRVKGKCSSSADHGTGSYQMNLDYNPDTTCNTTCVLRIFCGSGAVKLHCNPVCGGGMNFRSFTAERVSLGEPDNNNDGLPDASGSLDHDKIKKERIVCGDTLLTTFRGKIKSAGSVTTWRYGKAKSVVPYGRFLSVADARVKIYRNGSMLYNCGSLAYTTSLSGNTRIIEFDFGIPALISSGCPLYSGFQYFSGDSIQLEVSYVVSPNPGNFVTEVTMSNEFYMSTVANPSSTQKYQCDTFSGRFVLAGTYFTNCCTNNWYTNSCDVLTVSNNFYLSIGNCCSNYAGGNFFPFEYRPWAKLAKVIVLPPKGFDHVYSDLYQYRTAGSAITKVEFQDTAALSYKSLAGDTLVYNTAGYYTDSSGGINISDDGFTGVFRTRYRPTCNAGQGSAAMQYLFVFEKRGAMGSGYDTFSGPNSVDYIFYNKPEIKITAQETEVNAWSDTVEWRLRISNNSTFSDAENVWIGAQYNGNIRLIEAIDLSDNSIISLDADFLPLGDILKQGTKEIILKGVYTNCHPDSIELLLGANCSGYPDSIAAYPCVTEKLLLKYKPLNTRLDVSLSGNVAEVNLCEPVNYTMKIINTGRSRVYDLYADLILRAGMVLNDTAWLRLDGSDDSVMVTGKSSPKAGVIRWDLSGAHNDLQNAGLGGINDPVSAVYFTFTLETDCNFASSSYLLMKPGGFLKCGDPVNAAFEIGDPIDIKGITKPYFASISLDMDPLEACGFGGSATLRFLNLGPDTTKQNDRIQLIVPDGIYVDSLVKSPIHNAPGAYNGIISGNGNNTFEWIIPSGITAGDSSVFEIAVQLNTSTLSCEGVQIFAQSVVKQPALCVKDSTWCDINVVTADDLKLDSVRKSQFELDFVKGQSIPDTGQELVSLDYRIRNTGVTKAYGQKVNVLTVYDLNGNGEFDKGETVVAMDSFIDEVDFYYLNRSVSFGALPVYSCKLLLVIDSTNCVCSPVALPVPPLPLRNAGRDTTVCSFEFAQLGNVPVAGNRYSWSPVAGISEPDSSLTWFSIGNTSPGDSIYRRILATDKGRCVTRDTVNIKVKPQMFTNYRPQETLCLGDSIVIGSPVTGGTGFKSYQWSPVTGIKTPNNAKTFAKPTSGMTYTMMATDGIGCVHTDSVFIDVKALPVARLTVQDTCEEELFTFSDRSVYPNTGFDSIRWEIEGVDTFYNKAKWYRVMSLPGTYTVNLYVQDSFGCRHDTSATLNVYPLPVPAMAIHDDCHFDTTTLADLTTIPSGTYQPLWIVQGDTIAGPRPVITLRSAGRIPVEIHTVSEKGCRSSITDTLTSFNKPVTTLSDTFMCEGDSIVLQPQVTGDSIVYTQWLANGQSFTGAIWPYRAVDTTTIFAEVITGTVNGCYDTATAQLAVHPLPVAAIQSDPVCEGDTVYAWDVSTISKGRISERWWNVNGNYFSGDSVIANYYATYGKYPVSLAVKSQYGCSDTVRALSTVHYRPIPRLLVNGNCEKSPISFSQEESLPDSIRSIRWQINGFDRGSGFTGNFVFGSSGDHTIRMQIESNGGCYSDSTFVVHMDPKPLAAITWNLPCADDLVSFEDNSVTPAGVISDWKWTLHDNTNRYTDTFSNRYGSQGNFDIQLEVSNNFGCKDTANGVVQTNPMVKPSFTIDDACAGQPTRVTNTSEDLTATINDIWFAMGNGDTVRGRNDFSYNYLKNQSGTRTVAMQFETLPGCIYRASETVEIYPLPKARFTLAPEVTDILHSTVEVSDESTGAAGVYYEISDGSTFNDPDFSHRFTDSGTYVIKQIAYTDEGCSDTFSNQVRINFIFTFFVPNTVTPDGDGVNDVFRPTGYGIAKYELIVFNRWGEILFRSETEHDAWDPGDIMQGVYFYRLNVIDYENLPHIYTGTIHVLR